MTFSDDDDDGDVIYDGPASVVTRVDTISSDGSPLLIAVKTSSITHTKEPHDIIKEARLLASLSHSNIIPLIDQEQSQGSLSLRMPYIPYSLDELLRSSGFSPHPIISFGNVSLSSSTPREIHFITLAKSVIFQILSGVSYLHSERVQTAHRDIKPSNVLLTSSGRVQLVDFGIAFCASESSATKARDLWPESAERMYFEVSTGPYRAPELLFGPRTYDAFAIDAWSLGAVLAEFFTPLRLGANEGEDDEPSFLECGSTTRSRSTSSSESPTSALPPAPFIIPHSAGSRFGIRGSRWTRESLFDASRGEIGLAWSIFKIRGTPGRDTWPSFLTLPDAGKLSFVDVSAANLRSLCPNLPPSDSSTTADTRVYGPSTESIPSALDLINHFLVYEPSWRLHPSEALSHPWFRAEPGLMLPIDVNDVSDSFAVKEVPRVFTLEGQTVTIGDLLQRHMVNEGVKSNGRVATNSGR